MFSVIPFDHFQNKIKSSSGSSFNSSVMLFIKRNLHLQFAKYIKICYNKNKNNNYQGQEKECSYGFL
jgi:hypothetical protein